MGLIVLIVDDDKAVRFFHQVMVTQSELSAAPLSFKDGEDAFNYLDHNFNEHNTYLILLDINMPVMNGWDLIDAIGEKSYSQYVHIVMVTSGVDRADHEKARLYKMVLDVVEKPISVEECKRIMQFPAIAQLLACKA